MINTEKYDRIIVGVISGFILPLTTAFLIFLFSGGNPDLSIWLTRIVEANITTHIITLSAFSNILVFLLFNHYDMLRASRGVLGITIAWAVLAFIVKFLL